jgi:acetylornithine deacetylase/succinyl-diaminopimelate desuccinylase-like protein
MRTFQTLLLAASAAILAGAPPALAQSISGGAKIIGGEAEFRALYKELVETNTTGVNGSCTKASEQLRDRFLAAGYPAEDVKVVIPPTNSKHGNVVVKLPGTDASKKPMLLLAHIDVVEARREDWERDPFVLTEEGGFFYARGASDDKSMAAIFADMMVRFKKDGYKPERTIKAALTCGEEGGSTNGVRWIVDTDRELIDAEFALNEGAGGRYDINTGKYLYNGVQAGEKLYQDFTLEVTNPGGHSSRPVKDNAINRLAAGLKKVQAYSFPIKYNDATRGFLDKMSAMEADKTMAAAMKKVVASPNDMAAIAQLRTNPSYNAILHTTCVATLLTGGHASNALPQRATANVNCRIFPGETPEEVRSALITAIGDEAVSVSFRGSNLSEPAPYTAPPLTPEILGPIEKITQAMWPGLKVVPTMAAGATDGRKLTTAGIPTYGVSGIFSDGATTNAHGLNERLPVKSLFEGRDFLTRLVKTYAGGK